ncbi:MAG TPA: lipopolysaccharide heptosyltransferase I [Methylotenera sp.]|nr:lipopolysaccharide heptosyltransferase I [Methylotenera sp.]HPV45528.1 lipopolysaccharide heptosyltransferase I [Methylotenera sp.]
MLRILLIKTSSLGDVIHNLPVATDIRAHFPNAQIDWVVEESFADIPRMHPAVNQVMTVAMRRWRKQLFSAKTWSEIAAFKKSIQQNYYDAIIDTQGLLKSALITCTANGIKHGYDKNSIREPLASRFYDRTYTISYQQHAVVRNRTLAALSLGYAPSTEAPDYGISAKHTINNTSVSLMDIDLQADYIVGLHGTSRESKLWPTVYWVDLGRQMAQQNLNLVLPWANEAEFNRAGEIAQQLQNVTVLPKLSIAELAGVIADAQAAVGVDTGLSHLAAALDKPTIAIYTDTNPALTGVMAGIHAQAINLGNIGEIPSVSNVLDSLNKLLQK